MSEQGDHSGPAAGAAKTPSTKRMRKRTSPWKDWKSWGWEQIEMAIDRTVAAVRNGPDLRAAVNVHCDRVNAIFARLNDAYDRRVSWIEATEYEPERRQEKINRLFGKYYQIKRGITRKADRILVRMLKRATEAGEWR